MNHIVIAIPNEIPRRYPIPETFTYRELGTIKTVTGLRPGDFEDALNSGDPDIVIALAIVCANRAGHKISRNDLMDLEVGAITVEGDDETDPTIAADEAAETPETTTIHEDGGTQPSPDSTESDPGN